MTRAARLRIALAVVAAAVVTGVILLPYLFDWRAGKAFARVQQGDEQTKVILYLGYPSSTGGCGTQLRWNEDSLGANDGRCVKEVRYNGRHGVWVLGYSANGHVVSKYFDAAH